MRNFFNNEGREGHQSFSLAILVSFVLFISACAQPPDCLEADVFCAALVTDTLGIEDHGVNHEAWLGLEESSAGGLADHIAYIESVDARDYAKNIAYFADRGYDAIVTSAIGLMDETRRSADRYPDSVFVGVNQPHSESRPNLIPITFPEDQMGFLAGALAARLTKTGVVAGVCETSGIDSMRRYCEGFRAGAQYADETIKVHIAYRDEGDREKLFIDEAWGYDTAKRLILRGADVVFAAGGVTGQGALRAATESRVYAIGAERDQAAALGESGKSVVTSVFGSAGLEVREAMRAIRSGQFSGARIGQIKFTPPGGNLPKDLEIELTSLLEMWRTGELDGILTPVIP
jgi:basic membrane protein A